MAKEENLKKKKGTVKKVEKEVVEETTKKETAKKTTNKATKKSEKIEAKKAIAKEKEQYEKQIDALIKDKKATKDKTKRKEINREIEELKYQRSRVGKKDTYLSDIYAEMRLVRWPNKSEMFKYTMATLIFILFFAAFFYGIDALFALVKDLID